MKRIALNKKVFLFLALFVFFTINLFSSHAQSNMTIEEHMRVYGSGIGIAVELSTDGNDVVSVGILFIKPILKRMTMVTFNFALHEPGVVCLQDFNIENITKIDPQKVIIKGKNEYGYEYIASYSVINYRLDFNLVIEGRGRVEIRSLSKVGMKIKNKYLKHIELGWINP